MLAEFICYFKEKENFLCGFEQQRRTIAKTLPGLIMAHSYHSQLSTHSCVCGGDVCVVGVSEVGRGGGGVWWGGGCVRGGEVGREWWQCLYVSGRG